MSVSLSEIEPPQPDSGAALSVAGVDPEHNFAGGETQVLGLTLELLHAGHRAELICDPAGRLYERARRRGVVCHPLRIRNSVDLAAAIRFRAILRRGRYDIVHFHTARAHAMAPYARGFARGLIVTRRMDYRPNRVFAPILFGRAVDAIAAISLGVADSLAAAGVARERVTIIRSGVDCRHFRPAESATRAAARATLGIDDDALALASVGMLEARKGHRYLLEAVARLARGGLGAKVVCVIAGDGSLHAELDKIADTLGIAHQVRFLGRVDDVRTVLAATDIFVFPSLQEGLGVAVLEAAASGLPAVASDAGGIGEVIEPGVTGILVPPGDSEALADAIGSLAADSALRAAMGQAARIRAEREFAMSTMAARTLELYRACLAARGRKN
ncbi:MAG TPA: glycosyltransferase [Candidatus Binataceae bacterium]|nr:glycosyltransferase [Candidatus Binataceae bacterium]